MIIYLDVLFVVNLAMDYLLLLVVAKLCAVPACRVRLLLGGLLGAMYAVVTVFVPWAAHIVCALGVGWLMISCAFWQHRDQGGKGAQLRRYLLFLLISGCFAGISIAIGMASGSVLYTSNGYYCNVPLRIVLPAACICYLCSGLLFHGQLAPQAEAQATLTFAGNTQTFVLLCDSGNQLHHPTSQLPVLVLAPSAVARLFPAALSQVLADCRNQSASTAFANLPARWRNQFTLLPFCTASGQGLLLAFLPDCTCIDGKSAPHWVAIGQMELVGRQEGLLGT